MFFFIIVNIDLYVFFCHNFYSEKNLEHTEENSSKIPDYSYENVHGEIVWKIK